MIRGLLIGLVVVLAAFGFIVLRRSRLALHERPAARLGDDEVHLSLDDIRTTSAGELRLVLRYGPAADSCTFQFDYLPKVLQSDSAFVVTRGRLSPVHDSRGGPLLEALARAHGVASLATAERVEVAGFDVDIGILGSDLSRGTGPGLTIAGAFTKPPAGPWQVLKLFLPAAGDDDDQPELFLALNVTEGAAILLPKDAEYWPLLALSLRRIFPR